jgi:16S rRNA (uracil1498-N3)-methyltransferase
MTRIHIMAPVTGETVSISDPEQLHHLRDVMRLKAGDEVVIFDNEGNEFLSQISGLERRQATLVIKTRKIYQPARFKLTMAVAIPRQSRMDDIIDKLTQLSVDNIIPLVTQRVVVKLEENKDNRLMRWNKIARSAAEQSQRNKLPVISQVTGMPELLEKTADFDLKLIPTLEGEGRSLKDVLAGCFPTNILVLIGPEGDFTSPEIQNSLEYGFVPVTLGQTVLRVETAAIAVASYLRFVL